MANRDTRPVFLNLFAIRFPVTAILSIMHRIAGVIMVIGLPFALFLFSMALENQAGYKQAVEILNHPFIKVLGIGLVWSLSHHLLAGIRFLFLDLELGVTKPVARLTAYIVNISAVLVTLVFAGSLL